MPTVEVLHRVRGMGYAGAKTALYKAVRMLRPRNGDSAGAVEGVAGEFSQHDFGQVDVRYLAGGQERIHFFASRLRYSRWIDLQLVADERIELLVRSLLAGFARFGGIPLVALFDNPKTVTLGRDGRRILWNDTLGQMALDYGFGVELCTPARARRRARSRTWPGSPRASCFNVRR